jgi:hypothetical protein
MAFAAPRHPPEFLLRQIIVPPSLLDVGQQNGRK